MSTNIIRSYFQFHKNSFQILSLSIFMNQTLHEFFMWKHLKLRQQNSCCVKKKFERICIRSKKIQLGLMQPFSHHAPRYNNDKRTLEGSTIERKLAFLLYVIIIFENKSFSKSSKCNESYFQLSAKDDRERERVCV